MGNPGVSRLFRGGVRKTLALVGGEADPVGATVSRVRTWTITTDPAGRSSAGVAQTIQRVRESWQSAEPGPTRAHCGGASVGHPRTPADVAASSLRGAVPPALALDMPEISLGRSSAITNSLPQRRQEPGSSSVVVSNTDLGRSPGSSSRSLVVGPSLDADSSATGTLRSWHSGIIVASRRIRSATSAGEVSYLTRTSIHQQTGRARPLDCR
jgi:hypothetical protein